MKIKTPTTEDWKLYESGKAYNLSLDLYNKVASNERFYRGDQWEGARSGNLPRPVFNIFKRMCELVAVASAVTVNAAMCAAAIEIHAVFG